MVADRFIKCVPATPDGVTRLRREVVAYAEDLGAPARVVQGLRLAVSEALTNVVVHAYLGREAGIMSVEAWCAEEHLTVRVVDEGHGLIPRADSPGLGLGISLMARMSDDFRIANREGSAGTIVSLRFSLAREATCAA